MNPIKCDPGLIFDVGMHVGKDTEFYLRKGFRVVAVEASLRHVETVSNRLRSAIDQRRLTICPVAIGPKAGRTQFYINLDKDDWGTLSPDFARRNEKLGTRNEVIEVDVVPMADLLALYGIPYYLKIDIEGADMLCLEALHNFEAKPQFVSIEIDIAEFKGGFEAMSHLWLLGYRQFKMVNQMLNPEIHCPVPPKEGQHVDASFDFECSGPFGEESPGPWVDLASIFERYQAIMKEQALYGGRGPFHDTTRHRLYERWQKFRGGEPVGWYDLHAKLAPAASPASAN